MIVEFEGYRPQIAASAFVAPTAVLIGNVVIHEEASVWYGAILRGDHGEQGVVIGDRSNVQDNAVIHVAFDRGTTIGRDVTIGHGATLEACDVGDGAVIGMNSVILEHALIGARSMIAAGSAVVPHTIIPPDMMAAGSPAVVKKAISGSAAWWIERSAAYYVDLSRRYRRQDLSADE